MFYVSTGCNGDYQAKYSMRWMLLFRILQITVCAVLGKTQFDASSKGETWHSRKDESVTAWESAFWKHFESHVLLKQNCSIRTWRLWSATFFPLWGFWPNSVAIPEAFLQRGRAQESFPRLIMDGNFIWLSFVFPHQLHPRTCMCLSAVW